MNIVRAIKVKNVIVANENILKVSDSKQGDTLFITQEENTEAFLSKVDAILEPLNLEVVRAFKATTVGNLRTFIGTKGYVRPTTELA